MQVPYGSVEVFYKQIYLSNFLCYKSVTRDVTSIPLHKGHQEYHHKARNQGTEDKVTRFQQISLTAYDMAHPTI